MWQRRAFLKAAGAGFAAALAAAARARRWSAAELVFAVVDRSSPRRLWRGAGSESGKLIASIDAAGSRA